MPFACGSQRQSGSSYPTPVAQHACSPHTTNPRAQSFIEPLQINPASSPKLEPSVKEHVACDAQRQKLSGPFHTPPILLNVTQLPACCQKLLNLRNPACWECRMPYGTITNASQLGRHMKDQDMGLGPGAFVSGELAALASPCIHPLANTC